MGLLHVARSHRDGGAGIGEHARRFETNTRVASRDDDLFASKVDSRGNPFSGRTESRHFPLDVAARN